MRRSFEKNAETLSKRYGKVRLIPNVIGEEAIWNNWFYIVAWYHFWIIMSNEINNLEIFFKNPILGKATGKRFSYNITARFFYQKKIR